jgi:cell division protein ZipA
MNELRWILLAAGLILIAGLYFWGMRSHGQRNGGAQPARRTAPGGGSRFESPPPMESSRAPEPTVTVEPRRIEPSISPDADVGPDAASSRRAVHEVDFDVGEPEPAVGKRREPTISAQPEAPRAGPSVAPSARPAPTPATAAETSKAALEPKPARKPQKIVALRLTAGDKQARFDGARLLELLRAEGLEFGRYDIFHRPHENGRPVFSVSSLLEPGTFDLEAMPRTAYPGIMVFAVLPGPVPARDAFDEMMFTARGLAAELKGALFDEKGAPLTAQAFAKLREDALEFERAAPGTG